MVGRLLAPAKVYRTFYRALHELHVSVNWAEEVMKLDLLHIFELGPKESRQIEKNSDY